MNNFLGIKDSDPHKANVVILPCGFENTTTYGRGTKNGPAAIIKASSQVELFDEELWQETHKEVNIFTEKTLLGLKSFRDLKNRLEPKITQILKSGKLPITLGGEHAITPFIISAFINSGFKDFSILQFDAHADLRDGYLNQKFSHASAMRRCLDFEKINLVQIGIRNISNEDNELVFWEGNQKRVKTFWAKDAKRFNSSDPLKYLKKNVYLTFDVDVFDSSVMPSTGTPEPGGLNWFEVVETLRKVAENRRVIGADFVELSPIKNFNAPDFLVAKLIYKTIGYLFSKNHKKTK